MNDTRARGSEPHRRSVSRRVGLVRRDLRADWRRLSVGVLAIGLALMLVLLLEGLWQGIKTQASVYPDHVGAQLFVTQPGVANFLGASSSLPIATVATVERIPGVDWAAPVRGQFVVFDLQGQKVAAYLVGYNIGEQGGPWKLASGRTLRANDEVVIDSALAQRHGLHVGAALDVGGHTFRVVGLSAGTSASMTGFVFVTNAAADALLRAPGTTSYVLVGTHTPTTTRDRLQSAGLTVFTSGQLGANDRQLMTGIFGGPMNVMVGIAFIAGILIVALTVYASVLERRRDYGVIKAIGGSRRRITAIVLRQAFVLSAVGLVLGGLFFLIGRELLGAWRPQFSVVLTTTTFTRAVAAAAVMALMASVMPARHVANTEPAEIYRSVT